MAGVLDPRTIDEIAELVCGYGQNHERSVRTLLRFFEGVGWAVDYPGGPRVPWLIETIRAHNDDKDAIEALLKRVIDPREYRGGIDEAHEFVAKLNQIIELDGAEVGYKGSRPYVRWLDDGLDSPDEIAARLADPALRAAVRVIVRNPAMAEILVSRLDEVEASRRAGAYVLAVIGTGSFIEGLLFAVLSDRDPGVKNKNAYLSALLNRAHELGLIGLDAYGFSDKVRDFRNYVHPSVQLEKNFTPDGDTVLLSWAPVLAVINDLRVHAEE